MEDNKIWSEMCSRFIARGDWTQDDLKEWLADKSAEEKDMLIGQMAFCLMGEHMNKKNSA